MKYKKGLFFLISISITVLIGISFFPLAMEKEEGFDKLQTQLHSIETDNAMKEGSLASLFTLADIEKRTDVLPQLQEKITGVLADSAITLTAEEETAFIIEINGLYHDTFTLTQGGSAKLQSTLRFASFISIICCIMVYGKLKSRNKG